MSPTLCTVQLEEGGNQDCRQDQLETVVPKTRGARLLIVSGTPPPPRPKHQSEMWPPKFGETRLLIVLL